VGSPQAVEGSDSFPAFVIVTTTTPGAAVRVTAGEQAAEAPLVPVPGGTLLAAVVFVDVSASGTFGVCGEHGPEPSPGALAPFEVAVLDEAGASLPCVTPPFP